jgi:hypothetical protein
MQQTKAQRCICPIFRQSRPAEIRAPMQRYPLFCLRIKFRFFAFPVSGRLPRHGDTAQTFAELCRPVRMMK